MNKKVEIPAVALGATTIFLTWILGPLLSGGHDAIYRWNGSASTLFVPAALDFSLFWLVLTCFLLIACKRGRLRVAIWSGILLFTPWIEIKNWSSLSGNTPSPALTRTLLGAAILGLALLVLLWRPSFEIWFERIVHFASVLLVFAAVLGVFFLVELGWFGWQARALDVRRTIDDSEIRHSHSVAQSGAARLPKVVWIIFDELSYRQVYEHRFPGVKLPAFDRIGKQSSVFTDVIPAGLSTAQVIPTLMTGVLLDKIRSSPDGQLSVHHQASGEWKRFNEHDTVFQDAIYDGYGTAVAGWYNPYCRILPEVLDQCFWTYNRAAPNGILPNRTAFANLLGPLHYATEAGRTKEELTAGYDISDYREILNAADRMLGDPSMSLVLIHLPVPHPPGKYNRHTNQFTTTNSTYIDNLALADECLDHIQSELEQSGHWDSSSVLIMGDHSWRTILEHSLTKEELEASDGGHFDTRPFYLVKLPYQVTGITIDTPFATVNTRRLLDRLLTHSLSSPEDLHNWTQHLQPAKIGEYQGTVLP
ncbi:sulfatase-like hydrolase/transferase [Acidisarcina polymorpha]|nr:sulfatase-like hydrolase/transferase [Acidisarcina polymorpha]